jgi:hypothetical protein
METVKILCSVGLMALGFISQAIQVSRDYCKGKFLIMSDFITNEENKYRYPSLLEGNSFRENCS